MPFGPIFNDIEQWKSHVWSCHNRYQTTHNPGFNPNVVGAANTEGVREFSYLGKVFKMPMSNPSPLFLPASPSQTLKEINNIPQRAKTGNNVVDTGSNRSDAKNSDDITDENVAQPIQCYFCGLLFTSEANVKNHWREVHTGENYKFYPKGKELALKNSISSLHSGGPEFFF